MVMLPTGDTIKMGNTTSPFKNMNVTYEFYAWKGYFGAVVKISGTDMFDERFEEIKYNYDENFGTKYVPVHNGYTIDFDNKDYPLKEIKCNRVIYEFDKGRVSATYEDGSIQKWDKKGNLRFEILSNKTKVYRNRDGNVISIYTQDGNEYHWDNDGNEIKEPIKREFNGYELRKEISADGTEYEYRRGGEYKSIKSPDGTYKVWLNEKLTKEYLSDGTKREWICGKLSREKLPDGSEQRWGYKDVKIYQKLTDGRTYEWFDDGKIRSYTAPDKSGYTYYESGQKASETLPDGTKRGWYENGNLRSEYLPDGTLRLFYSAGQPRLEKLPDGTRRLFDIDGKPTSEKLSDGTNRSWYKNGNLCTERLPDGTEREWYENGNQKIEKLPDGTEREWYENGNQKKEELPDGTERAWYENGNLASEKLPDGSVRTGKENGDGEAILADGTKQYFVDGKISSEKLIDGTRRTYDNGVLLTEYLFDNTTRRFYPNGQMSEQKLPNGSSAGWYIDGSKKFEEQPNGSRQEWHLNGNLSEEILCSKVDKHKISETRYDENGKRTHFEHLDKDGKDDTRMYLAKQKVAAKQVEKGAEKGKVQKKLNPISKAWKLHKALKEVDAGK